MDTKILELLIKNFEEGKYKTLSIITLHTTEILN